jgi:GT2 family glycosyltransferase
VARGKFIWVGAKKLLLRGVTYGPFRPEADGSEYHDIKTVARDFAEMAGAGINTLRTYTVPPGWLLDCARQHGLWVLVGLPWEQHVAFLDHGALADQVVQRVREGVRQCAGHPALLGFAVGNEIPTHVVRWHGHRRIEHFIKRLYHAAKTADPGALVAYVNYPSTEYLELPFVDLFCFNVFLEAPEKFQSYLARLQTLAGDRPLILSETGLDSSRNGEDQQAAALAWQIRLAFQGGVAGLCVFSWTDEWHRGGNDILDWDFGLTRRDRSPKSALAAVARAFAEIPFEPAGPWPRISVVLCTYRGVATLEQALTGLQRLDYPDYEVIVVNDGADPGVEAIARKFPVQLINTPHQGLSVARNTGCQAATGQIVAYLDDDAWPDPHWLQYLAFTFATTDYAAVGGPNIPPASSHSIGNVVLHAPGGPVHVLLSDTDAEHIPGCNMAFRKAALQSMGGFDPQFRVAGDDVDICWRFHDSGLKIGFNPGAMVWHNRRQTIRGYLKQQFGYGRAEALLERKWPAKYNAAGQPGWHGRIYGLGHLSVLSFGRSRIYHGTWGSAFFQSLYEPAPSTIWSFARMPEWFLFSSMLTVLFLLGFFWKPLLYVGPLLLLSIAIPMAQALLTAHRAPLQGRRRTGLLALLHLLQPLARLRGRLGSGLSPWRPHRLRGLALPGWRTFTIWSESWHSTNDWLLSLENPLEAEGAGVFRGGDFDSWDLEVRGGVLGSTRLRLLAEEHGANRQFIRIRAWPQCPAATILLFLATIGMAVGAAADHAPFFSLLFGGIALALLFTTLAEWSGTMAALIRSIKTARHPNEAPPLAAITPTAGVESGPATTP